MFLHGSTLRSLFVVVYRPGSVAASTTFFDEFADLLDHVTTYSSVVIMGDVNLHLDVPTDASTSNFSSLLAANNLVQVCQPISTASPERVFSKLERTLTAIRSTMSEERLEALVLLQAHRDRVVAMSVEDIIDN